VKRAYLVRHGKAEDYGPNGSDADRRLTADGRHELEKVAKRLRKLDDKIEIVLTSPLRRAVETAEILAKELGVEVKIVEELEPPVSPNRLLAMIKNRSEHRSALVGHEPGLGQSLARWLEANINSTPLKKAAIARVDIPEDGEGGANELAWLAPPDLLTK
jgi:phosphohistidine phosphatase